jgi:hypothetical protein
MGQRPDPEDHPEEPDKAGRVLVVLSKVEQRLAWSSLLPLRNEASGEL